MSGLSSQLLDRVRALRPDWAGARVSGFIYLEGGYSNHNYRFEYAGERFVLRVPYRTRNFVDRRLERRLYATGTALGVPELVAFDDATGDMISRWVPGTLLADRAASGRELVDYLGQLHVRMPMLERTYDPVAQARGHLAQARAPGWVETLAAGLDWRPGQQAPCHNDLNPWNVIVTPDGPWITLDWEWAGRNDPLFDLVTLHQTSGLPDSELARMCERLLGAPVGTARITRCLTAFWLREATWAMAEIEAGNDRPEVVEQAQLGVQRLERLLA